MVPNSGVTLTGGDVPEIVGGAHATADYFRVFGALPALGRGFVESDDRPGAPPVVVLSHRLWVSRFGGDSSILGRQVPLNEVETRVIGVMPKSFDVTSDGDELWVPLRLTSEQLADSDGRWMQIVARLADGVTVEQAAAAASGAERRLVTRASVDPKALGMQVRRYVDHLVGDSVRRLFILLGAVGFVLMIACVNVSNLLMARGTSRARELAVRAALGAGRGRLIRQLLAESLVLALTGALLGIGVAFLLVRGLVAIAPDNVPRLEHATINGVVLAFALVVAAVTSIVIGLFPALHAASPALEGALREGGRGSGASRARERLRATFVAAEVAMATALLTGAGLLIRTAWLVQHIDPGFKAEHVLAARTFLPVARFTDGAQIVRTYERVQEAAAQVPGVEDAALTTVVPLSHSVMRSSIAPEGRTLTSDERTQVDIRYASTRYFDAMGIPMIDGRDIARTDVAGTMPIAVISRSLAAKLWPGERAVGKRIDAMSFDRNKPNWVMVVGVAGDVHDTDLGVAAEPTVYMPFAQMDPAFWQAVQRSLVVVVRTTPEPSSVLPALRRAVASVDASLALAHPQTMDTYLSDSVATARFNTILLAALGAIALLLASVGVYGVVAYFVNQRTREIGVRLALGATPAQIWRLVLRRGYAPIVAGAVLGVGMSFATGWVLREQLFGVSEADPLTLVSTVALLLGVALVAIAVPARRAMRVPPAVALTSD